MYYDSQTNDSSELNLFNDFVKETSQSFDTCIINDIRLIVRYFIKSNIMFTRNP